MIQSKSGKRNYVAESGLEGLRIYTYIIGLLNVIIYDIKYNFEYFQDISLETTFCRLCSICFYHEHLLINTKHISSISFMLITKYCKRHPYKMELRHRKMIHKGGTHI